MYKRQIVTILSNVLFLLVWKLGLPGFFSASILGQAIPAVYLAVRVKIWKGPDGRATLAHGGQLMVDEMLHAGVLQADGVHQAGGGLVQALTLVAGLAVQGQSLAGDAAEQPQILDALSLIHI